MPLDPDRARAALQDLIPDVLARLEDVQRGPTLEDAKRKLRTLQLEVAKAWRTKARELHPDLHGDDPEKTARFKSYAEVIDWFKKVELRPMPPPPRFVQVTVVGSWNGTSSTTTNATFHGSGFYRPGTGGA